MTLTLVATAGATNANCYCTLAEAETYAEATTWKDDWSAASTAAKNTAIANAARIMDTMPWLGVRTTETQAMKWPRSGSYLSSPQFSGLNVASQGYLLDGDGYEVATDTIPTCVKNANAEFALRLLGEDRAADAGGIVPDSFSVGSLSQGRTRRYPIPASVKELVRDFLKPAGTITAERG